MRTTLALSLLLLGSAVLRADKIVLVAGPDAADPKVKQPFAVDFDQNGVPHFVEMTGGERLRRIEPDGKVVTLAGSGKKGLADGEALNAEFNGMHNLVIAPDGMIYLADAFNAVVRKYDPKTKTVSTFAGTGKKGFGGDGGPVKDTEFSETICIALTPDGKTMYVADIRNKRVRAIDMKSGVVSTFAGTGKAGVPKDGEAAKDQPLVDPRAVAADDKGNVYILERSGHALRVVDKTGKIRTVAGTGKAGAGGDGGPALKAAMNGPKFLALDKDGSVLITDTENHQIRRYVPGKETMGLVAGTGKKGGRFGADPKKLELARPHGASVHPKTGDIYIADSDNDRVLRIER
jgi:DNA-binding beta-propeller fold protein YncE